MADSDKIITITPNTSVATTHPEIKFVGKDNSPMYLRVLDDNSLSFEGTEGQVFSMSPTLSSGDIFSVNDISGMQSMAVNADGTIKIIPTGTSPSSNLYVGDLKHCFVYARGTGNNNAANSLVYLNGHKVVDNATRGLMLTIVNQTDLSVVSSTLYDTYSGGTTNVNNLATAIGNMTDQQIGILVSEDAWEPNSGNGANLWAAAKLVGLTKLGHYDGGDGSVRRPYAAIFMGSGDDANAANKFVIERMSDADGDAPMASISAILVSDGVHASISGAQNQNALWSSDSNHEEPALFVDEDKNVKIPNDSAKLYLGASDDLSIYHDGSNSYINEGGTGNLRLDGTSLWLNVAGSNIARVESGQVKSWRDVNVNDKIHLDADTGRVGINNASPAARLDIIESTGAGSTEGDKILLQRYKISGGTGNQIYDSTYHVRNDDGTTVWTGVNWVQGWHIDTTSPTVGFQGQSSGGAGLTAFQEVDLQAGTRFFGHGNDYIMTIDGTNDRVGIGTTAPDSLLEVSGTSATDITAKITNTNDSDNGSLAVLQLENQRGADSNFYLEHNAYGQTKFSTGNSKNHSFTLEEDGDITVVGGLQSSSTTKGWNNWSMMRFGALDYGTAASGGAGLKALTFDDNEAGYGNIAIPTDITIRAVQFRTSGVVLSGTTAQVWRIFANGDAGTGTLTNISLNAGNFTRQNSENANSTAHYYTVTGLSASYDAGDIMSIRRESGAVDMGDVIVDIYYSHDI